uniref:Retrotransposon protein, putative, Ty3-gypsy subclass n=1 Tax=Oryza sativa subsp. japonica TaxID=39947 RepID=Q2QTM7_ORYSJ|nr:retrotransposon protein, putative, Ty3-gypsy subclass [Oryza sativa Japonica Group]
MAASAWRQAMARWDGCYTGSTGEDPGSLGEGWSCFLGKSLVKEVDLGKLVSSGSLTEGQGSCGGKAVVPSPGDGQTVVFAAYFAAGLRLTCGNFLPSVLSMYEARLPQLSPLAFLKLAANSSAVGANPQVRHIQAKTASFGNADGLSWGSLTSYIESTEGKKLSLGRRSPAAKYAAKTTVRPSPGEGTTASPPHDPWPSMREPDDTSSPKSASLTSDLPRKHDHPSPRLPGSSLVDLALVGLRGAIGLVAQEREILEALKKRLEEAAKGKWPEEMLSVLWALRMTPTRPTKFSPFMLLYGDEAMTPTELGANSPRVTFSGGEEGREVSLELLEGVRVEALEHMRKYATGTSATYNKKVRPTELLPGHLVLRKKANPIAVGKIESKWEGPYLIKHRSRTGSFRLVTLEGEEFDHSWNAASLKRFYV